jgi:hypothetical protein
MMARAPGTSDSPQQQSKPALQAHSHMGELKLRCWLAPAAPCPALPCAGCSWASPFASLVRALFAHFDCERAIPDGSLDPERLFVWIE